MNSTNNSVVVVAAVVQSTTTTCDSCGYAAAIIAAICLGTLGVPIKSEVVSRLDVDALVMQVRSGGRFVHVMSRTYLYIHISKSSSHLFPPPLPPPPLLRVTKRALPSWPRGSSPSFPTAPTPIPPA
jgi:hypothetical protein